MAEETVIVDYFRGLFSDPSRSRMGRIDNADVEIEGELCPRRGKKDQLFLYARLEKGLVGDIKFMCSLCDPHMFVAADILCRLALGKDREEVERLEARNYEELLGGQSADGYEHFKRARELLVLGMMGQKKL